jgi:hypothetical protein
MWRRDVRPPSDSGNEKARDRFPARASQKSCDDAVMPLICPTCQILTENSPSKIRKIETNSANRAAQTKKPAPVFPARVYNSCDDVDVPLICPTCQPAGRLD